MSSDDAYYVDTDGQVHLLAGDAEPHDRSVVCKQPTVARAVLDAFERQQRYPTEYGVGLSAAAVRALATELGVGPPERRDASSDRRKGPRRSEEAALHYAREALIAAAVETAAIYTDPTGRPPQVAGLMDAVSAYCGAEEVLRRVP